MASLEAVVQQLKANQDGVTNDLGIVAKNVTAVQKEIASLVDIMKQNALDMLEANREKKDTAKETTPDSSGLDAKKGLAGLAAILAGIAAVAGGILKGLLDNLKVIAKVLKLDGMLGKALDSASDIAKGVRAFFTADGGFGRFISGLRGAFRSTFVGIGSILDDLIKPFKDIFGPSGPVGSRVVKFFNLVKAPFSFAFEPIMDDLAKGIKAIFGGGDDISFFKRIGNMIKAPFDAALKSITKALDFIKGAFKIFSEGSDFMRILGNIGRVIGRLFLPFTIIMTAFDTVKGAIAGFEEDGFLGGMAGAIKGFLNSVIGAPLDLLKKGVEFVLKKMGFDQAAEIVGKFSFTKLISNLIDGIFSSLKSVIDGIIEAIAVVVENIPLVPDSVGETIRGLKFDQSGRIKEKQTEIDELQGGLNTSKIQEEALKSEISTAKAELEGMGEKFDISMSDRLNPFKSDELKAQIAHNKEIEAKEEQIARRSKELNELSAQRAEDRAEIIKLKKEIADLQPVPLGGPDVIVSAPNNSQTTNSSSSSAMVMPLTGAQDTADTYYNAAYRTAGAT